MMTKVASVHVVVLNWNRPDDTIECVDSLLRQTHSNLTTWVVDNGSRDDSVERIRSYSPLVRLVESKVNRGFAGGNNLGIQAAMKDGADYIWLLNNDTVVTPDAVEQLVSLAEKEERVGAIGARVVYHDDPDKLWFGGMRFRHGIYFVQLGEQAGLDYGQILDVDFVSGCAMFLPRATIAEIGLLDENYFMYYEDQDYCLRLKRAGLRILYTPAALVRHKVSQSMDGGRAPYKQFLNVKSAIHFCFSNLQGWQLVANLGLRFAHAGVTLFVLLFARRLHPSSIGWYLRGLWSSLTGLLDTREKHNE